MPLTTEKVNLLPPRILIYGEPKKGKSTFGYQAPSPIFLRTEDGLADLPDAITFPMCRKWSDVTKFLSELVGEEHGRKTLVIDSLDWLESLIHTKVCQDKGVKSIADIGYGAGFQLALVYWREYIHMINTLNEQKKMMILQVAHSEISNYKNPDVESFSKHVIKMHAKASALIKERSDIIIFVSTILALKEGEGGFVKTSRAVGGGERVLYTSDKNNSECGSRFKELPQEIPFDRQGAYWNTILSSIPYFNQQKTGE